MFSRKKTGFYLVIKSVMDCTCILYVYALSLTTEPIGISFFRQASNRSCDGFRLFFRTLDASGLTAIIVLYVVFVFVFD